jgi:uncharacterized protein YecE (DUF72 family)
LLASVPRRNYNPPMSAAPILLGTSAFTAAGWPGTFYPADMPPKDFLSFYATRFHTVEVDSTYYRTPSVSTVKGWAAKTPEDFIFSMKVPQVVTHEKCLLDCEKDFENFVDVAGNLGKKLGPMLLQFPYFNKSKFKSLPEFLARLKPFLKNLPRKKQFALEIRNKSWLAPPLIDLLKENNVALALIDQAWMPPIDQWFAKFDPITADFTYIRWLGDRKGIEQHTKIWDKTIVDRSGEMQVWVKYCRQITRKGVKIYAYANNHYAGHGPATVALFQKLWEKE